MEMKIPLIKNASVQYGPHNLNNLQNLGREETFLSSRHDNKYSL